MLIDKYTLATRLVFDDGHVNGRQVKTLRDTGSECNVIRSSLVQQGQRTGKKQSIILLDNSSLVADQAIVDVVTPYCTGQIEVLCVENPICDLVIGNGATAIDPPFDKNNQYTGSRIYAEALRAQVRRRPKEAQTEEKNKSGTSSQTYPKLLMESPVRKLSLHLGSPPASVTRSNHGDNAGRQPQNYHGNSEVSQAPKTVAKAGSTSSSRNSIKPFQPRDTDSPTMIGQRYRRKNRGPNKPRIPPQKS